VPSLGIKTDATPGRINRAPGAGGKVDDGFTPPET